MHVLIALDDGRGVLVPVTSPLSTTGPAERRLAIAADFVAALVSCGACNIYELESDEWILEVRPTGVSSGRRWIH